MNNLLDNLQPSLHDTVNEHYARVLGKGWLPEGQSDKKVVEIKDIPIMITPDGAVVCIPKLPDMGVISCVGITGCLSGDSIIPCNRGGGALRKYTIKYLYNIYHKNPDKLRTRNLNIPTFVRSFNGKEIRLHKIEDVVYSGKKKIYGLILKDGKNIKATADHKFLTKEGWKPLEQLKIGEEVMCDKPNASKSGVPQWVEINVKNEIGEEDTYDIRCAEPHHNFVANGIVVHNSGKSLLSGRLLDDIFWSWGDYIGVMNDSQEETYVWSEPCDNSNFILEIKRLYQKPVPLPMVYLFPNFADFKPDPKSIENKNSITISIPFEEVMQNIQKYIPDLGNSEKYVLSKKDELLGIQNEEELFEIISGINTGTKGMAESEHKIESSFRTLINEGILNLSNPSIPSYLTIWDKKEKREIFTGNPFTAIMKADCIPSLITGNLYNQKFKDAIFSYYINSIFDESLDGSMKGKRVWLYFDELTKVVHSNPEYNSPETERALTNIASRGRNNGLSMLYVTQSYNEIPKPIRSQTKYAIIFRHKAKELTKMICDDFALDKNWQSKILNLKKFECIAASTEHFVLYKDDKKWEEAGPIKGKILPALHKNRFLNKRGVTK